MIRSWRLKHFKSVAHETSLELAPLTVFAGPNSSGKSTVIQSILLTAQTVQSPVHDRPVVLNGPMARLGSFTDIVSGADESEAVTIGFTLNVNTNVLYRPRFGGAWRDTRYLRLATREGPLEVDCEYSFSVSGPPEMRDVLRLQPRLERAEIRVRSLANEEAQARIALRRSKQALSDRLRMLRVADNIRDTPEVSLLNYEVEELYPPAGAGAESGPLSDARLAGAALQHFVPSYVTFAYDVVETEVRAVVDALTAKGTHSWRELGGDPMAVLNQPATKAVINAVLSEFEETRLSRLADASSPQALPRNYARRLSHLVQRAREGDQNSLQELMVDLPPVLRGELSELFIAREEALTSAVRRGRRPRIELATRPVPPLISAGASALHRFFAGAVEYLGPLRDDPKPVYPLSGATDPSDVGLRGQHTAAVLDVHRNTPVTVIEAAYFLHDVNVRPQAVERTLLEATLDWLRYMGVGTDLTTEDRGKLGHELKIAVGPDRSRHDLTQVGVGVSQVLPILVLSFIAESGATLIFEQPELHLHPRVQTRLADFFVALAFTGKQCIVETHSEYLINQLRYRAAIADGDTVSSMLGLYFVEKEGDESKYRSVLVNPFGVIEDWPRGFFDEKERTAAAIMKAAMVKRHRARE